MENRVKKWARFFLCFFLVKAMFWVAFPCTVSAEEQKDSSWTGYFSRFLVFWENDADKKGNGSQRNPDAWKKIPVDFSDFLPDNLPGISEYRQAVKYQRWQDRPAHQEQEVYDLFGLSAQKGNVLALIKQYEMYRENPDTSEDGKRFFADRLNDACRQVYPVAVTGNPDAQYLYARYCVNFKSAQAQSWYTRAKKQYKTFADRNVPYAQYMLGEIYQFYGEEKTAQDWFMRSAKNGNADAVCRVKLNLFHEEKLWKNLGSAVKGNHSCAVYQALRLISQTNTNKVAAKAATELLMQIPVGYAQKGFEENGYQFYSRERPLDLVFLDRHDELTESQLQKSKALVEKYRNNKAEFVDEYLDKFDWNRLSPFGD